MKKRILLLTAMLTSQVALAHDGPFGHNHGEYLPLALGVAAVIGAILWFKKR
jgi:hydrogenase/urease accessory protein HupE